MGSNLFWKSLGMDVGLECQLYRSEHFHPFLKGGIGFRDVVKLEYFSKATDGYKRYRWYYPKNKNE